MLSVRGSNDATDAQRIRARLDPAALAAPGVLVIVPGDGEEQKGRRVANVPAATVTRAQELAAAAVLDHVRCLPFGTAAPVGAGRFCSRPVWRSRDYPGVKRRARPDPA